MDQLNIMDLPPEVIIKIFNYLDAKFRIPRVAEVCQTWSDITPYTSIVKSNKIELTTFEDFDLFLKSSRNLKYAIKLSENIPTNYYEFTEKLYENITEMTFSKIAFENVAVFALPFKKFKNVTCICLQSCTFKEFAILPDNCSLNVTKLWLMDCYLTNAEVALLLSLLPTLEELSVSWMKGKITFEEAIVDYLQNPKASQLRKLSLTNTNNNILHEVFTIKHLNLEHFEYQSLLKNNLKNNILQAIFENMVNLQSLVLKEPLKWTRNTDALESTITDEGFKGNSGACTFPMSRLQKLEKFTLYTGSTKFRYHNFHVHEKKMTKLRTVNIRAPLFNFFYEL